MKPQLTDLNHLKKENALLLAELESAYQNMARILEQSSIEKEIAYRELEKKFSALEELYAELSNKENMLIHLEKLSSIGQFITEIIHELKNPLTVISGVAEMVLMDEILSDDHRQKINRIPQQVKRMSDYLNRFRAMAYKGREDFKYFDLNENLLDFVGTIEIIKPKEIKIVTDLAVEQLYIYGDPYQTTQIYLNLAKNAFDAMQECGKRFLINSRLVNKNWVTEDRNIADVYCQSRAEWETITDEHEEFALVEFSDEGDGIPEDLISNIFEAFFTTKKRGMGTGLGLSIAADITKRHHGNLAVKSQHKQGTTFQLLVPTVDAVNVTEQKR